MQKQLMGMFKKEAQRAGKPLNEFMQKDGKVIRDKLMKNKQTVKQYDRWLKGDI